MKNHVRTLRPVALFVMFAACEEPFDLWSDACSGADPSECHECITNPNSPDYAQCGGAMYTCEDGEWRIFAYCEIFPIRVEGRWTIDRSGLAQCGLQVPPELRVAVRNSSYPNDQVECTVPAGTSVTVTQLYTSVFGSELTLQATEFWDTSSGDTTQIEASYRIERLPTNELNITGHIVAPELDCDVEAALSATWSETLSCSDSQ